MKIVQCHYCKRYISKDLPKCPYCLNKNLRYTSSFTVIMLVFAIILGAIIVTTYTFSLLDSISESINEEKIIAEQNKVTYENFSKIEIGMTYEQVVEIFGEEGKVYLETSDLDSETKLYEWYDSSHGECRIWFEDNKVTSKTQVNLK